jgi:hypothetical protein
MGTSLSTLTGRFGTDTATAGTVRLLGILYGYAGLITASPGQTPVIGSERDLTAASSGTGSSSTPSDMTTRATRSQGLVG